MSRFAPRSLEPLPMTATPPTQPTTEEPATFPVIARPEDSAEPPPMLDQCRIRPAAPISRESADRVFVVLLIVAALALLARAEGWL